uniref:Ankyrin repeat protein n=1 Tax=Pithovirus LCPAC401 TaxID=2506595 RepID=A0A481Z9E4_9VIRU|nr:MAG: ankyrin repeat protein [Pithovirus LCPAC401]
MEVLRDHLDESTSYLILEYFINCGIDGTNYRLFTYKDIVYLNKKIRGWQYVMKWALANDDERMIEYAKSKFVEENKCYCGKLYCYSEECVTKEYMRYVSINPDDPSLGLHPGYMAEIRQEDLFNNYQSVFLMIIEHGNVNLAKYFRSIARCNFYSWNRKVVKKIIDRNLSTLECTKIIFGNEWEKYVENVFRYNT